MVVFVAFATVRPLFCWPDLTLRLTPQTTALHTSKRKSKHKRTQLGVRRAKIRMSANKRQCVGGIASIEQQTVPPFVQNPKTWRPLSPAELKNPNQELKVCLDEHLKGTLEFARIGNHTDDLNESKNEFFKAVLGGLSKHRSGNAETARTNVRLMDVGLQIARNIVLMGANTEKCDKRDLRHVENVNMEDFAQKTMAICEAYLRYNKNIPSFSLAPKEKTYRTKDSQTSETSTDQMMESRNFWADASKLLSEQPMVGMNSNYGFNDDACLKLEQDKQRLLENNQELKDGNCVLKKENILLQMELEKAQDTIRKLEAEKLAGNAFGPDASLKFLSLEEATSAQGESFHDIPLLWESDTDPNQEVPDYMYQWLLP